MLNALRRGAKTLPAKLLIALLIMGFAVWGVQGFVNQVDPTKVATVGDTPVSASAFARRYERTMARLARQRGSGLTPQQAMQQGIPQQVLQRMVTEALQVDAARSLGLGIGDDRVSERIRSIEAFAGSDGTFDRARFDRLMQQNRYSEAEFIEIERDAAVREMWVNGLLGGYTTPEPYLSAVNRYLNQTRTITHFPLTEDAIGPIPTPDDETLRTFYDDNTDLFRAPERRSFAYVSLNADAVARPDDVPDAEVRQEYERSSAYGVPEKRRVQQIPFDDPARARQVANRLSADASLDAVLSSLDTTFDDVTLGLVARSELVDPAAAEAAFTMQAGEARFVDGRFGPIVVHVSEVQDAQKQPFSEVEGEIRRSLAADRAESRVNEMYPRVEDAVAGGARVQEIAERFELPLSTVDSVSRQGVTPDGERVDVPRPILSTAFSVEPGQDAEPVRLDTATAWIQTESVTDARERPFDAVRGEVLVQWTEAEKTERLARRANKAVSAIETGEPVERVAARADAEPETSAPFSRSEPPQELASAVASAAFEGPQGHAAQVVAAPGRHVVFKVTSVSEPTFFAGSDELGPIRSTLNDGLADTMLTQFLNAWQAEVGATQNRTVIEQIVGLDRETR